MNFSHNVAPRIKTVNYEWDTSVQRNVSCTVELVASVEMISGRVEKALHTYFHCQRDSRADRT